MTHWLYSLRTLFDELRRRQVFRVGLTYGVVAWLLIQIASTTFPALHLPGWGVTLVIMLALLGYPVALVLAWAFEITPEGVRRTVSSRFQSASTALGPQAPEAEERYATPFLGRAEELEGLRAALQSPPARMVTIVGPGGIGKTRLAMQAATLQSAEFAHGFCFVPLAGLGSVDGLVPSIAARLRIPISAQEDARRQLIHFLAEKHLLLLLDNFEHLIAGSDLLTDILAAAPGVRVLVTSRERLNLHAEVLFPIQGLRCPPHAAGDPERFDAYQLFVRGAQRVDPRFRPSADDRACIVRICELVEGFPLALELAAAWTGTLSCAEVEAEVRRNHDFLSAQMRDVPERHRSLRAVFESSWNLLSEQERRVYRRLSLFRGGFTREAAEQVAQASLGVLSTLLGRSMLWRTEEGRFEAPEVLRQFAVEKLAEDPAEAAWTRRLYSQHFCGLLHQLRDELERADSGDALARLAPELDNVREAWSVAVQDRDVATIGQAYAGLFACYDARGWVQEGERAFDAAVTALRTARGEEEGGDPDRALLRAQLTVRHGAFCYHLGLHHKAQELIQRGLEQLRGARVPADTAFALDKLGQLARSTGELAEARSLHEESLSISRETGDARGMARSLISLGLVLQSTGDYAAAQELHLQGLERLREVGDHSATAYALINLGATASLQNRVDEAVRLLQESLALSRRSGNQRLVATALQNLGYVEMRAGNLDGAEGHLREAIAICKELGLRRVLVLCMNALCQVLAAHGQIEEMRRMRLQTLEAAVAIRQMALVLHILVHIARDYHERRGATSRAVELLEVVLRHPAADRQVSEAASSLLLEIEQGVDDAVVRDARSRAASVTLESAIHRVMHDLHAPTLTVPS